MHIAEQEKLTNGKRSAMCPRLQPAVRTVLNWVVAAPFVGSALDENYVTFKASVTDANGNVGVATRSFQLTHSAANGDQLTPQP